MFPFRSVIVLALVAVAGCGSDTSSDVSAERLAALAGSELKPLTAVSGKVLIDGAPAAGVNLGLYPATGGAAVRQARTMADGTYAWSTHVANDGIEAGSYVVTFEHIPKERKNGESRPEDDLFKGKYRKPEKSEFKLDVVAGAPQENVDYDLKSK